MGEPTDLKRYNLDEIRKAISVLFADVKFGAGECIEVRVPDKKKRITAAGWFDDVELMATAVAKLARDGYGEPGTYRHIHENAYWTCNPASDALLARQPKNKIAIASDTTSDNNITRRIWLPIDIDPLRPSGVSATKTEKTLAAEVANTLMAKLTELGVPDDSMIGGSSGNGYHILLRIDLPNDPESRDLIKQCLAAMQGMVGTGKVEVDPKVFNAARIIKCYGTLACKGMNTKDRPWRWSKLTLVPDRVEVCPREILSQLAGLAPDKNPKRNLGEKRKGPWTVENTQKYIDWTTWECGEMQPGGKPGETGKWIGPCVENQAHKDAALILHDDGWWSYSCFHASCSESDHKAFRAHWEEERGEKYDYPGRAVVIDNSKFEVEDAVDGEEDAGQKEGALVQTSKIKLQPFALTDAGNMERFVCRYGHGFRYCPQRDWYSWDGKRWVPDDIGRVYRGALATVRKIKDELPLHIKGLTSEEADDKTDEVLKWAKSSESRTHLSAVEFLSRSAKGIAANFNEFDRDEWLFNCDNGTIDLRSGDFQAHSQADMLTNISPAIYDPEATCPLWEDFLNDVMAENRDMIGFLQRAAGYSLTGSTVEHCLFLLWGTGRNGKSTFLEVLGHIIGTYGQSASMSTFLEQKYDGIPNDLAALAGSRFVTAVETQDSRRLDEAKVKQITGGDTVSARFLHKEFFQFRPQFKIWLATNHRPVIHGTDEGIWRRLRLIPFTVYIPDGKKDEKLRDKLISEASGILNWMLEGLVDYRRDGLQEPEEVTKATEEYRTAEDWLARFLGSETIDDVNSTIQARRLYERYVNWAGAARERVLSERKFGEAMKSHSWKHEDRKAGKFYIGHKLRDHLAEIGAEVEDLDFDDKPKTEVVRQPIDVNSLITPDLLSRLKGHI